MKSKVRGFFLAKADVSAESVCVFCLQLNYMADHALKRNPPPMTGSAGTVRGFDLAAWTNFNREGLNEFFERLEPEFGWLSRLEREVWVCLVEFLKCAQPNTGVVLQSGLTDINEGTESCVEDFIVEVTADGVRGVLLDVFVPLRAMFLFVQNAQIALDKHQSPLPCITCSEPSLEPEYVVRYPARVFGQPARSRGTASNAEQVSSD